MINALLDLYFLRNCLLDCSCHLTRRTKDNIHNSHPAAMSASMSASSSSLHGDPSDDPSHNPFMSEPVSEGIVAEAREDRMEQEEEQQQHHAEMQDTQPQERYDGYNLQTGGDNAATTGEHASSSTSPQQPQQQQQQVRRPARPTLRDNTQWKDEIKVRLLSAL